MSVAIFYDTETTGLPDFKARSSEPHQPHIVQLAAALVDLDSRKIISSMNFISKPDGWEIPAEAAAVHGITTELALTCGLPEHDILMVFLQMAVASRRETGSIPDFRQFVAHNVRFDARIIRIALARSGYTEEFMDAFKTSEMYCTMENASKIMQLPPTEKMARAGFTKNKPPNLGEAYKFFTGKTLEGAHDAMVDVQACIDVYFGILDWGKAHAIKMAN